MAVLKYRKSDGSYAVLTAVSGGSSVTDISIADNNMHLVNGETKVGSGIALSDLGDAVKEAIDSGVVTDDDDSGTITGGDGSIVTD